MELERENNMASNALFFGWSRSIPGRESISLEHFTQFMGYLNSLKANGTITSFDPVFLNPHGSAAANGFFLLQGDSDKLHALSETPEWIEHVTRGTMHLEGATCVFGAAGTEVAGRMQVWTKSIPTK